jgi:hypothetical protein
MFVAQAFTNGCQTDTIINQFRRVSMTQLGFNHNYLTENEVEQIYTVVDIAVIRGKRLVSTVLIARLLDNQIVVELDHNNKELGV